MTGPAKFSPIPRSKGPEYLARCIPLGYWWLTIQDRHWEPVDSKFTDITAAGPLPDDDQTLAHLGKMLAGLGFGVPPDVAWAEDPDQPGTWIVPVVPVTPPRT